MFHIGWEPKRCTHAGTFFTNEEISLEMCEMWNMWNMHMYSCTRTGVQLATRTCIITVMHRNYVQRRRNVKCEIIVFKWFNLSFSISFPESLSLSAFFYLVEFKSSSLSSSAPLSCVSAPCKSLLLLFHFNLLLFLLDWWRSTNHDSFNCCVRLCFHVL